jgi:UDP-glucose 6-dehydrogenase
MFSWKKPGPSSPSSDVYANNRQLLELARQAGDKKNEIILSLVAVVDDAMKMREAHNRIIDLFDDGLEDLLEDACLHFSTELSAKLSDLRQHFDCIDSEINEAASHTIALVKQVAAHIKT